MVLRAVDFVPLLAGAVLLASVLAAAVFLAGAVLAVLVASVLAAAAFVPVDFAAVDFGARFVADVLAADVLAADALAADVLVAAVFVAAVFVAAVFLARERDDGAGVAVDVDFFAAAPLAVFVADAVFAAVVVVVATLGSFFAPLTTSLKPVPARKAGTDVALTLTAAPVAGLRAVRALRARFSKTPKPVIATRSPRATERTMMSTTWSTAC